MTIPSMEKSSDSGWRDTENAYKHVALILKSSDVT